MFGEPYNQAVSFTEGYKVHYHNHDSFDEHHNCQTKNMKKLLIVFCLTVIYMIAEFVGGVLSNSLALMADAGHMLSDAAALGISVAAAWISLRPASFTKTYGYHRAEIFAALINGLALVIISSVIVYEAYLRVVNPPEVQAPLMIIVAFGGLVVNIIAASILHGSSQDNINVKGAFLHVLGDLLGSVGAVVAGFAIYFFDFYLADPIISFVIAALILLSAFRIIGESVNVLFEASPSHIDVEAVQNTLLALPNAKYVHHLHVWSISSGKVAMSVHIVVNDYGNHQILYDARNVLKEKFGINHSTIQIEPEDFDSESCVF
jgi:cobalt-zinc-cadmium efflux system protein